MSVFPNPTKGNVDVVLAESLVGSNYTLYDLVGKGVLRGKLNQPNEKINLKNLTNGSYILKIEGVYNQSMKIIKL